MQSIECQEPENCAAISDSCYEAFINRAVNVTNMYRAKHGAPPQFYTSRWWMERMSRRYACKLVNQFQLKHNKNRGETGENLYVFWSSHNFALTDQNCECRFRSSFFNQVLIVNFILKKIKAYAEQAVTGFYNEIHSYDFNTGYSKDGTKVRHFTQ